MDNFFTYTSQNIGKNITDLLVSEQIPIHTLSVYRKGQIIYEHAFEGHIFDELHHMFSISKTITAIAILYLDTIDKLSLEDYICTYFTDLNAAHHELTEKMTIRDMLMMRTVHSKSAYTSDCTDNWCLRFFDKEPDHESGTEFSYDTSGAQVLAALVERLTGKCPLDFVKEHIKAIGFSKDSYSKPSPDGYHMGGTGLMATHTDIRALGVFLLDSQILDAKDFYHKYLPELTADESDILQKHLLTAASKLTDTAAKAKDRFDMFGYGYMIWQNEKNGFMLYGLGGQFVLIYPERELIVVTTGDTNKIKGCNDRIFEILYNGLEL